MIPGEYYHLYNRGAHKAPVFNDACDYERFVRLLYAANGERLFKLRDIPEDRAFDFDRGNPLVDVIAYCLMPNHFHIAVRERQRYGTTEFLRKICTGYGCYYNIKYKHSGTIFQGKYKCKPVDKIEYLTILINYIHLNPFGIKEPNITKEARIEHMSEAIEYSKDYEYSSFKDYLGENRAVRGILAAELPAITPVRPV
ncbi:transposase [Patescibacteria group bacterium]|nr:transposase [Patescibacteria group bacterium]MDE1946686.1 transposase [Patescibacteria group bacterium]